MKNVLVILLCILCSCGEREYTVEYDNPRFTDKEIAIEPLFLLEDTLQYMISTDDPEGKLTYDDYYVKIHGDTLWLSTPHLSPSVSFLYNPQEFECHFQQPLTQFTCYYPPQSLFPQNNLYEVLIIQHGNALMGIRLVSLDYDVLITRDDIHEYQYRCLVSGISITGDTLEVNNRY